MGYTAEVETALLEWINSFPLSQEVSSWRDLNNGVLLWEALRDIDQKYFAPELPQHVDELPGHWMSRWENLRQVHKSATAYTHHECNQILSLSEGDVPDLKAIAKNASAPDSRLLVKYILAAAINSQSPKIISRIQTLSKSTQETFKTMIEEMQNSAAGSSGSSSTSKVATNGTSTASAMDRDLFLEAQLSEALAEKDRLLLVEATYKEQGSRLNRALEEKDTLNRLLRESQDEGARLKSSARRGSLTQLQAQLQQQSDVIAGQEETIAKLEEAKKTKQKQIDSLRSSAESTQKFRDEIDVLKAERDTFAKKANAADKYRQKLQASQQLEQDNQLLRTELAEIKSSRVDAHSAKDRLTGLELAVDEYRTALARSERDHDELRTTKMHLQHHSKGLSQKVESLLEQQARDQEFIKELQDRANDSPMTAAGALDLDEELNTSEEHADALSVAHHRFLWARTLTKVRFAEISKLKAEKMANNLGAGSEGIKLQMTNEKYERLEVKYLNAQEEKLELESQLNAIQDGAVSRGYVPSWSKSRCLTHNFGSSEAFISLRQKWNQSNAEVERLEQVVWETTQELNKIAGELANAEMDISLVDKDKLVALQELKKANSSRVLELESERKLLVERVKSLEVDLNLQRDLLNKALLDKDSNQTSLVSRTDELRDTEKANAQLRSTLETLKAASSGREQGANEALENHIVTLSETLEISRENLTQRAKVVQRSLIEGPSISFSDVEVFLETKRPNGWFAKLKKPAKPAPVLHASWQIQQQDQTIKSMQIRIRQADESRVNGVTKANGEASKGQTVYLRNLTQIKIDHGQN
ncbi:MAG: hypothetical protein M1812_005265 [Candelaria pacifica]|nr:MAG: hypothetical protein M1812_005265 [Candelaria pacifica]